MILLVAAVLSLALGAFVALFAEERRVRPWFILLCVSSALVSSGLWFELHSQTHAFLAARMNMTFGFVTAGAALMSCRIVCGSPIHRGIALLLGVAAAVNIATVWATDLYFSGEMIQYSYGTYVAANPKFVINPLLVGAIVVYGLVTLLRYYPHAHGLDKNRIQYLMVAYLILSLSVLDYVPHFGWNPFGRPVVAVTLPLFLTLFGYASLRFRLVEFGELALRATGWFLTVVIIVAAYAFVVELAGSWPRFDSGAIHVGAAVVAVGLFAVIGRRLPDSLQRAFGAIEANLHEIVQGFSDDTTTMLDETALGVRLREVCSGPFESSSVELLGPAAFADDPVLARAARSGPVIEPEVLRRRSPRGAALPFSIDRSELIVPLLRHDRLLGALALGPRTDGSMYSRGMLQALRTLGNVFTISLENARAALELQKRHQLDRYLAPQVVERILAGGAGALDVRQRAIVTVCFSDLKDFTPIADKLDPEALSLVLNEYLSAMSDVAFRFGGTIDKFIGDAVMVLFGAPVAAEAAEQVDKCLGMAIEMQRTLAELNTRWLAAGTLPRALESRIGIHTGEATVGSFGNRMRADYTAIGRTVNLASRLEGACQPGRILLSATAWAHLRDGRGAVRRGAVSVKGFEEAVEVFELDPAPPGP